MSKEKYITLDELAEIERKPKTKGQITADHIFCLLPPVLAVLVILAYYFIPNSPRYVTTNIYAYCIGALGLWRLVMYFMALNNRKRFDKLRHSSPLFIALFLFFFIYDVLTIKSAILMPPFFASTDSVLAGLVVNRELLTQSTLHSLSRLFTGFFAGASVGLVSGILAGWSRKIDYWISPVMRIIGPIPSTTWIPLIMAIMSLASGSIFIIALGVWYPVTMASKTGIANVRRSYYEAAKTLGAKDNQLIYRIAIPAALPSILQGITQGMSTACGALIVSEMMGVQAGLGWYITWQKSWSKFDYMYGAIALICVTFIGVNLALGYIKKRVLKWQEGTVK